MSNPSEQPNNDSSLSNSFQELQISSDLRQKRDEYIVEIQKKKREEYIRLCKRSIPDTFGQGVSLEEFIADCQKQTYTMEQLNDLIFYLNSPNHYRQSFAVVGLRKLLCNENNPPTQQIIDAGAIPKLVEFLGKEDEIQLQVEAAWALTNMASRTSEQTKQVVDNGAVPGLVKLLGSHNKDARGQAIWALGNIAADNEDLRDVVRKEGAIGPLIKIIEEALAEGDILFIKNGTWALSSLCQKGPELRDCIPIFAKVVMTQKDMEILRYALYALVRFSNGDEEKIQRILDTGVVPSLVKNMDNFWASICAPCLRVIGNLFKGNAEQLDCLLAVPEILDKLFHSLKNRKMEIRREAAWILARIAAGTPKHKELIVGNVKCLDLLFSMGVNDKSLEVRREVAQIFKNVMTNSTSEQLKILLEKNVLEYFGKLVEDSDDSLQEIGLTGIRVILGSGEKATFLEKTKTIKVIERLQGHAMRISKLTFEILSVVDSASAGRNVD